MERKSWSWKKKVLEKLASPRANSDSSHAEVYSKQCTDDMIRSQFAFKDQLGMIEATSPSEVKLRILSEQVMARDELVQQHAKVAEEAVTGWEKAECETACFKQQLDEQLLYKAAMEEQLVRLESALKENMVKVQHAEESERRLQKLVDAKSQELDSLRVEMQSTMSKVVIEMARAAKEADARSQAEDKATVLQKRVDMVEREQANLKYELRVLAKELDIRNEELELNKQAAENANMQHLENVKRTAKLEDDCLRLQLLLHKRTPGPAFIAQMRVEAETSCPTILERASHAMSPSSQFSARYVESALSDASQEMENRIAAVEEENKSLKETNVKKDGELQSARSLCAKMATKLSAAQDQLEKVMQPRVHAKFHRSTKSAMDGYSSTLLEQAFLMDIEDESNSAESWAFALITELANIKKDKGVASSTTGMCLDLMDDFVEMEKLALIPSTILENSHQLHVLNQAKETIISQTSQELRSKLAIVENELNDLKVESFATKAALSSIEKHLVAILQAEAEERASTIDVFEEVRTALDAMYMHLTDSHGPSYASCSGMDSPEVRDAAAWSPVGQSSCGSEDASILKPSPKIAHGGQQLCAAVHKVVSLFEELAQADWKQDNLPDANGMPSRIHTEKLWKTSEFECCVRSLVLLCNGVLDEKVDVGDFLEEIASALEWMVNNVYASSEKPPNAQRRLEFSRHENKPHTQEDPPKQVCALDDESVSIEKQLMQLKSEKEDIDTKLSAMTKELENLKYVLQNSEEKGLDGNASPQEAWGRDECKVSPNRSEVVKPKTPDTYQLHALTGVRNSIPTHWCQKVIHPDETCLASFERQQTLFTMVSGNQDLSIPIEDAAQKPDKEQEHGRYAEKLVECQQAIVVLGKQLQALGMPGYANEALPKSKHSPVKPTKAQRRAQRSFDQLHTISENSSSLYEVGHMSFDMTCANAMVSPDRQKEYSYHPQRDVASMRSPAKFQKSKRDLKVDQSPERQVTGLSRFFAKSKLLMEARP